MATKQNPTMAATDVYQSAADPSLSIVPQLPHVFVYPPAEEDDSFYCVFRGGCPSPTPIDISFCHNPPSSYPRGRPGHDLYRHDTFQQTRVVRTRASQWCLMYDAMTTLHDDGDNASGGSSEAEFDDDDESLPVESQEYREQLSQYKHDYIPVRPSSRRSSVFGSRPTDPPTGSNEVHAAPPENFSQSIRSKAMTVLKRIGKSSPLGVERSANGGHESWFDLDARKTKRKHSQNNLRQLSNREFDTAVDSNTIPSRPPIIPKLSRKKSVLERLRFSSESDGPSGVIIMQDSAKGPESLSQSLSSPMKKLSRRRSVARFFGSRSATDLGAGKNSVMPNRSSDKCTEIVNEFTTSRGPVTVARPESPVSLVSNASTARPLRRQSSFFRTSNTSVHDLLHRDINEDPPQDVSCRSSAAESLEASSEQGSSSPIPRSSDSLTLEDELQSPIQSTIPTIVLHQCNDHEVALLDDDGFLQKDMQMDVDDGPFGLGHDGGARHRTVVVDSPPMLDLAVHLNSLTFDTLTFDPDVFEDAIDDDT